MANYSDINYDYLGVEGLTGGHMVRVTNLTRKRVIYHLPELNIHREFQPATSRTQDTKTLSFHELYTLKNTPGGEKIIWDNLQIQDNDARVALELPTDPEYDFSIEDIRKLVEEGTQDEILDALEFGPFFIASQIKTYLVTGQPKISYDKVRLFEGLFRMDLGAIRENFEWNKQDEQNGAEFRALDTESTQPNQRRTSQQKELTPDDIFPARGQRRTQR